jgi:hypothetical protein
MFGVSASIFNEAGSLVRDWLKNPLNTAFFYWYFLPAVGFVLLQLFLVRPALGAPAPAIFDASIAKQASLAELVLAILNASFFKLILLPMVIGAVLSALSGRVLHLYEGTLPIVRPFFKPWLSRNRKLNAETYGPLRTLRRQYLFLVTQGVRLEVVDGEEKAIPVLETELPAMIEQLKQETQILHEQLEANLKAPDLPVDIDRVGATDLANTLALAEEYPFERYAIDTAVFWPRLTAEIEAEKLDGLKTSFSSMNGFLNLSLLIYVAAIELVIVGIVLTGWGPTSNPQLPLTGVGLAIVVVVLGLLGLLLGYGAYRAAVSSARSVGNAMRTAFDYYRGNILRRFDLKMPPDIETERVVWLKLAAFIRRGESFYYPSEFRNQS